MHVMSKERTFSSVIQQLKEAGLRPTRQRMALAKLLFESGDRHITAEQLHGEAQARNIRVSLATVYNSLHQFTEVGLLREVVVEPGRSYFDTNVGDHHHFYYQTSGELADIPADEIGISYLPETPGGTEVARIDVIIRLQDK